MDLVVPGDLIFKGGAAGTSSAQIQSAVVGQGCYATEKDGSTEIRASLVGKVVVETLADGGVRYNVSPHNAIVDSGIQVGDIVICRVVRLQMNRIDCDILSVNDSKLLQSSPRGVVQREDVRLTEVDALVMHDCFRPGDIVRAKIVSLGDARSYFCSTADVDLGVVHALSSRGNVLQPLSWDAMQDPVTKEKEPRKVAKPRG